MKQRPHMLLSLLLALCSSTVYAQETDESEVVYFTVTEIVVSGDNPLKPSETNAILAPYLGEQAGLIGLQNAAAALEQAMRAKGHTFHRVIIPPQRARGRFEFRALEFRLASIQVEGNDHFDDANVLAMIPSLLPGETPNSRHLSRELQRANGHPAKRLALTMKRSEQPDHVDALISVRDQSPHTVFLSLNNRGSRDTGRQRASVGYQYANLFDLDHVATLSYTSSPGHWDEVRQYGFSYRAPLYDIASDLTLLASHSDVDSGTVADFFTVTGRGTVLGATFRHSLLNRGRFGQSLEISLYDKDFDNDVDFLGQPIGNDVRSRPIGLRYEGEWTFDAANVGFHLAWNRNLSSGRNNDAATYAASRAGADVDWSTWTASAFADRRIGAGPWLLRARVDAQHAGEALVSGEQFGLGGIGSVRGFLPREAAADDGVHANFELWLPPPDVTLAAFVFADVGVGRRHDVQPGESRTPKLASAGLGLRWNPMAWLNLAFDFAYVLDGVGNVDDGDQHVHFNLTAVF